MPATRVQFTLFVAAAAVVVAGCSNSREDYAPLAEFVAAADRVTLYEGLPHQYAEKELLERELAQKETFWIGEFAFYTEPLPLTEADAAAFTEIFDGIDAFSEQPPGRTKCGPYHPDFCIEWTKGDEYVRVQICLGCGESKVYDGSQVLYLKLGASDGEPTKLLKDRRQNRPKTEMAEHIR